jgi:hypothetical protein
MGLDVFPSLDPRSSLTQAKNWGSWNSTQGPLGNDFSPDPPKRAMEQEDATSCDLKMMSLHAWLVVTALLPAPNSHVAGKSHLVAVIPGV